MNHINSSYILYCAVLLGGYLGPYLINTVNVPNHIVPRKTAYTAVQTSSGMFFVLEL